MRNEGVIIPPGVVCVHDRNICCRLGVIANPAPTPT